MCIRDRTYAILPAPDKATDYGDYPASEGETDRFVTFATVRGDNGLPAAVQVRVFPVSYTHLDVYKRQLLGSENAGMSSERRESNSSAVNPRFPGRG